MSRAATPYGTRNQPLALPRGTLDGPSFRLGGERTGPYLAAPGALGFVVDRFPALELTQATATVRSNAPGAGSVSPLALARANPTTADGQETALDVYEGGRLASRLASYRAADGAFGWRLYGSAGGALTGALLTATPDGDVALGRDLDAGRNARIRGNLTIDGTSIATGGGQAPTLTLTGPVNTTVLSVQNGNASLGGTLAVAGPGVALGVTNDASIGGSLSIGVGLGVVGNANVNGQLTAVGALQSNRADNLALYAPNGGCSIQLGFNTRLGVIGAYFNGGNTAQGDLRANVLRAGAGGVDSAGPLGGTGLNVGSGAISGGSLNVGSLSVSGNMTAGGTLQGNFLMSATGGTFATDVAIGGALSLTKPSGTALATNPGVGINIGGEVRGGSLATGGAISGAGISGSSLLTSGPIRTNSAASDSFYAPFGGLVVGGNLTAAGWIEGGYLKLSNSTVSGGGNSSTAAAFVTIYINGQGYKVPLFN